MGELMASLVPVALGIVLSPLAIIALVAVLFSRDPRPNSAAFLAGWLVGIAGTVAVSYSAFSVLEVTEHRHPPLWVPVVHLLLGAVMVVGAWFVIARERGRLRALAGPPGDSGAATTDLPKILSKVESFSALRCFVLGVGLFVLNPIDLSCAIAASLDLRLSAVNGPAQFALFVAFTVAAAVSVAGPVLYLWVRGEKATGPLEKLRSWVATNTKILNAALLIVIAVMQITKGVQGL